MRISGAKTDHVDWDALRTALFLARAGSVRRAARELGVSHSTVLRRLDALEEGIGVRLFERKAEGYELTTEGQDVFDTARTLEDIVLGLERRVEGRDLRLSGPVRVTLPDPFLPLLLPALQQFGAAYPEIVITVAADVGFADLAQREADIAIRIADAPPPELVGRRLATAAVAVYGSDRYLEGRSRRDLEALDWVGWDADSTMLFEQWMRKHVPKARVGLRVSTAWALRDAVDAGMGVALFPCALGGKRPGWARVHSVRDMSVPLWILTHRDLRTTARVRMLRDHLAEAIVEQRAIVEGRARE
jgi:DNA-binding transcriptional LysR family regulator